MPTGSDFRIRRCRYGLTRNRTLLLSVPSGVTTWTGPVAASAGTVVVIKEALTTVNVAAVPLNVTELAPVRSVPRILSSAPTSPKAGCVSTKGPRAHRQAEDRAKGVGPALDCRAVEAAVGALNQPRVRGGAVRAGACRSCRASSARRWGRFLKTVPRSRASPDVVP